MTTPSKEGARRAALESVRPLLLRLAARRAERSRLDRDDLFGEACVVFLTRFDRYDPAKGALTTWAGLCVRAALVRLARRERQFRRGGPASDPEVLDRLHAGREPDPADAAEALEQLDDLAAALAGLPERERLVIEGRFGLAGETERTPGDVAAALGGVSGSRVRQLQRRALRRLDATLRDA
jgi:RNA polymerase sporulation-specific sigma factor